MKKYISVSKSSVEKMMASFKVGERCVRNALGYRSKNELAKKIRFTAIKHHGGCVYYIGTEMECFFDSENGMHQIFPNGAEIYLDKKTGEGKIFDPNGKVAVQYDNVSVMQIGEMQKIAAVI